MTFGVPKVHNQIFFTFWAHFLGGGLIIFILVGMAVEGWNGADFFFDPSKTVKNGFWTLLNKKKNRNFFRFFFGGEVKIWKILPDKLLDQDKLLDWRVYGFTKIEKIQNRKKSPKTYLNYHRMSYWRVWGRSRHLKTLSEPTHFYSFLPILPT